MAASEPGEDILQPGQLDPLFPLLSAFSRILDRAGEMPMDPTTCLKRIGWIVADCLHRAGESTGHSLQEELSCQAGGRRSALVWDSVRVMAVRNQPDVEHGWVLKEVVRMEQSTLIKSAQLRYEYTSSATGVRHMLQLTTRGTEEHEFARFVIHGRAYYWYQHGAYCAFAYTDRPMERIVHPDGTSSVQLGCIELAAVRAAAVTYVYYDIDKDDCLVHRTFTTSHEEMVYVYHFRQQPLEALVRRLPYFRRFLLHNHLDYHSANEAVLSHQSTQQSLLNRLERLSQDLRVVTDLEGESEHRADVCVPEVVHLPHLSRRLTERRRARYLRVARTLVLTKAQEREEARAADPVRRCAACAVEAVKSQLALGIEPAVKRMCMRA